MFTLAVLLLLPLLGAVIGYLTKWTSVKLIFWPSQFVGIGRLGWQGVIQRRSPKFAAGVAATLRTVMPVEELLGRLDPAKLGALVADDFGDQLDSLAPVVIDCIAPGAWDALDDPTRQMVREVLRAELVEAIVEVAAEALPQLDGMVDLDEMVVELLSGENADRLARLVRAIGDRELRTVIRYGAVVGFAVGCIEAVAFLVFERWWLLPVIGALDGTINNWMGIRMIFRPLEPRRYLGVFRYQGLFPARQAEIAHDYGAMLAAEVLTAPLLATRISTSSATDELRTLAMGVLERRLAPQIEVLAPMLGVEPDPGLARKVIEAALDGLADDADLSIERFPSTLAYVEESLQIGATIEERLVEMDKLEFEKILRGIFEDDEPLLIGIGGVIGAAIGCLQAAFLLSLQ